MKSYDVCVIGSGGVVGSAIARDLSQSGRTVLGLERHQAAAQETSGRNSRVIHSGFHEMPGSLKATLARAGSAKIVDYARANGVPLLQTGMLIAVPADFWAGGAWREVDALWRMWRGGRRQNIPFHWIFTPSGVRAIAPIQAIGGIYIPTVHVVDVFKLVDSFQQDAINHSANLLYDAAVASILMDKGSYVISAGGEEFSTPVLINSAGLSADTLSVMASGPRYTVDYIRGQYYELQGGVARWGIRTLIYPVMPPGSRSKGIHLGPRTDGSLFVGPDASLVATATGDAAPATPKLVFLQAARKFLPNIEPADLLAAPSGIRPKYTRADGRSDFLIQVERTNPTLVNLVGIDSPGLSSCMAIADYVRTLLQ